jgi:hypothetical protein
VVGFDVAEAEVRPNLDDDDDVDEAGGGGG